MTLFTITKTHKKLTNILKYYEIILCYEQVIL